MTAWWTGRRLLVAGLALAAVGVAVPLLAGPGPGAGPASGQSAVFGFARVDRAAPAVTRPSLSGHSRIGLPSLAGEPIVINFWSSSCVVCRSETQALVRVADATTGRVRFLGIDTDDLRAPAVAFAARYRIAYPLSFDPEGVVAARYRLPGLPVTFFLAPSGRRILGVNVGALSVKSLTGILRELYGRAA